MLCPSGFGSVERFPVMEGARSKNYQGLVESTFFDHRLRESADREILRTEVRQQALAASVFETVRGTKSHSVRDKLTPFDRPTLVICGREDRIVDPHEVHEAVKDLPNYRFVMIPRCGHAPQLECSRLINRMVVEFLESDTTQVRSKR